MIRFTQKSSRYSLVWALCILCSFAQACGDDSVESQDAATTPTTNGGESSATSVNTTTGGSETNGETATAREPLGACNYVNSFSQGQDCKLYTGASWTKESAEEDCGSVLGGQDGVFTEGEVCPSEPILGTCSVGEDTEEGYMLYSLGEDSGQCGGTQVGCEVFLSGTFEKGFICDGASGSVTGDTFTQPYEICSPALEGEEPGKGPDGLVCTQVSIQGATEEGRYYPDYANCADILTQRPYYDAPLTPNTSSDDPRLQDPEYMREFAWINDQLRSTACTCCHAGSATPNGASLWDIESDGIWVDTMSENGLAMMAGFADSFTFGAFDAEENNGFDRSVTGAPTTDVERMRAFFTAELSRRNPAYASVDYTAFGGPLYDQSIYEPEPCEDGVGVSADGEITWTGPAARYMYVLTAESNNPGVPPNLDLPEGTLWRLDADPDADSQPSGLTYGEPLDGTTQIFPEMGEPQALEDGKEYLLYVLLDIAVPVERCTFVYSAE